MPLDTLLNTVRQTIFLPSHLPNHQRRLIYKTKNRRLLLNPDEPATVRVSNEVFQLLPLNQMHDEPPTRQSFAKVLRFMTEAGGDAWKNLPGFLEGMKAAGRRLRGWQAQRLVRVLGAEGQLGVLGECLRRVERTGLGLWEVGVVREAVWGEVGRCVLCGWGEEGVRKAAREAERVLVLLEDPRHCSRPAKMRTKDPKSRPDVVGAVLDLVATRAVLFQDRKDEEGKVQMYAEKMLALWANAELGIEKGNWYDANHKLMMWAPVWHGIQMARRVLGEESELARRLVRIEEHELEPLLREAREVVGAHGLEGGERRGVKMWEELGRVGA